MGTVARHYGLEPTRNGYIHCLFHNERTASMKLYPGKGGYHCFGCGAHGSVIDFTAELLNLTPLDAVKRLNEDFQLGLSLDKPPSKSQRKAVQKRQKMQKTSDDYEQLRDICIALLNSTFRKGHMVLVNWPDRLTESEALAVKWHETVEYWADMLTFGSLDEQIEVLEDWSDIEVLCKMILRNMRKESAA